MTRPDKPEVYNINKPTPQATRWPEKPYIKMLGQVIQTRAKPPAEVS